MLWSVATLLRRIVAEQPTPPRSVGLGPLLRVAYGSADARLLEILGLFFLVPLFGAPLVFSRTDGAAVLTVVPLGLLGILILSAPSLVAIRGRRAATLGQLAKARIIRLHNPPGIGTRTTIAGMTNGYRVGTLLIEHPAGAFESPFQYDGPNALSVRVGSTFEVLVAADRQRILLNLGLLSGG